VGSPLAAPELDGYYLHTKRGGIAIKRTRPSKTIIIQTTAEMDNWMHPQTQERKQRIKDRRIAAAERFKKMRSELPDTLSTEKD
jgi:hypothetical protein